MLALVLGALLAHIGSDPAGGAAFRALFDEHAPHAFRCLRRLGVPPGDVDDVLQEVFLVVLRRHAEVAPASPRAWIHGICARKAAEHRRSHRRRREDVRDEVPEPRGGGGAARDPEEEAARGQALARLDRVLDELPDPERAAFVLFEIEQLSLKEIGEAVGCPISTVHSRLERARERVARAFSRPVAGAAPARRTA